MAIERRRLNVAELDFDEIKQNLKNFLKSQSELTDYNFEGSAINSLLDVFAYVTHYNAFNANMAINETFLDTAQLRQSVVSHAKLLGYTPHSVFAPRATVDIEVISPTNVLQPDGSYRPLTLTRGTNFATIIDGVTYNFVNTDTLVTTRNANGQYIFENVTLTQGTLREIEYIYDVDTAERFIIPYDNVETSTMSVTVKQSAAATDKETFAPAPSIADVNDESQIYWLQEGRDGFYEVYFGDDVIGKKLVDGNVINIEYLVTDVDAANNASVFELADTIDGNSQATITTISRALGGSQKEDIASIKFNAPLAYVSQNRAVTPDDYRTIILANYANVDAISVWGGEDNDPPDYGKVYISIAPKDSETLPQSVKDFIITQYLKPKNVVSITPTIVDPDYTYIYLEVYFKYNPNITNLSRAAIENTVRAEIEEYNRNELKRFDGVFRHSRLLNIIDNSDVSVINCVARVKMKKRFVPTIGLERSYNISFSNPLYNSSTEGSIITSTEFTYLSQTCKMRDRLDPATGTRKVEIVTGTGAFENVLESDIGYLDVSGGRVVITGFKPTAFVGDYVEITASPNSNDLAPKRNELLVILYNDSIISGEVDTMITGGSAAGVDYTTFSRH